MIRKLFFTLVLANLAVAAWMAWFADPRPGESAPRRSGVPIRLVSEAEPGALLVAERAPAPANDVPTTEMPGAVVVADAPGESVDVERPSAADEAVALAPSIAATGVSEPAAAAEIACITVGPFADSGGAEAAAAALEAAAYAASQRSAEEEIWIGFWVHLPGIRSREDANAMLATLRENGVPDAYLIPGETDGDIISLGVLNTEARAGRLEEQARTLGFAPVVLERSRQAVVYWLDVIDSAGNELDLEALGLDGGRLEQRRCDAA